MCQMRQILSNKGHLFIALHFVLVFCHRLVYLAAIGGEYVPEANQRIYVINYDKLSYSTYEFCRSML